MISCTIQLLTLTLAIRQCQVLFLQDTDTALSDLSFSAPYETSFGCSEVTIDHIVCHQSLRSS